MSSLANEQMDRLPVLECIPELKKALARSNRVLLQAPPGAGKSTLVPPLLFDEPWLVSKKVVMLEPRRLAARNLAFRIASLRSEKVGETVGYNVRFERNVSERTRLEIVTEGILVRMLQNDNVLEDVGLVVFDEFHERSIHADLSLALMLHMQEVLRPDIRILIMSATLDSKSITDRLGNIPVITSEGKAHRVGLIYLDRAADSNQSIPEVCASAIRKAVREHEGDVLVFLPGAGEIRRTAEILGQPNGYILCPLYGDLSYDQQQEAILPNPSGIRKVILATAIAETSLTIEGVTVVIDSGQSRFVRFDPRSGLTRLVTDRVTLDSATQRAGRAGRLGPGVCYRLWTQAQQFQLRPTRPPEILEADLAPLVLELMQWGIKELDELMWITTPPEAHYNQALDLLTLLEARDDKGITAKGKQMLRLSAHPRIAHMMLEAGVHAIEHIAADVASLMEERDPLGKEHGVDLSLRVHALRRWRSDRKGGRSSFERIEKLAANWRRLLGTKENNDLVHADVVGFLLASAYPDRIGKRMEAGSERYRLANGRMAVMPPGDVLAREEWIGIGIMDAGRSEGRIFSAAPLSIDKLSNQFTQRKNVSWDHEREQVTATAEYCIGQLVVRSSALREVSEEDRKHVICGMIRERGLHVLGWSEAEAQWLNRVQCAGRKLKGDWPDVSADRLLDTLELWLWPYIQEHTRLFEIRKTNWIDVLHAMLPWELRDVLDKQFPRRIQVPSGSWINVQYQADGSDPVMEVRLQEVFGWIDTPRVCMGKVSISMHLLSPGYRPVQVTQDLNNFWKTTYFEVRKELRARYPKHSWPEDPLKAEPVRGVKKKN